MTKKLTVKQVAEQTIQEMHAIGMKKSTIEKGYSYYCFSLVRFYESLGTEYYDTKITAQYKTILEQRLKNGDLSCPNYLIYLKMAERMDEIFLTGNFIWMCKSRHKRVPLTPAFEYWFETYLVNSRGNVETFYIVQGELIQKWETFPRKESMEQRPQDGSMIPASSRCCIKTTKAVRNTPMYMIIREGSWRQRHLIGE